MAVASFIVTPSAPNWADKIKYAVGENRLKEKATNYFISM